MSGHRNRYPTDAQNFRQDYMNNLGLQSSIDDMNLKANQVYKASGQLPPQSSMPDNRTASEKLADTYKMKVGLVSELKTLGSANFAQAVVQAIENSPLNASGDLFIFFAQNSKEIIRNLSKKYQYGIKGDSNDVEKFRLFIEQAYNQTKSLIGSVSSVFTRPASKSSRMGIADIDELISSFNDIGARIISKHTQSAGVSMKGTSIIESIREIMYEIKKSMIRSKELETMKQFTIFQGGVESEGYENKNRPTHLKMNPDFNEDEPESDENPRSIPSEYEKSDVSSVGIYSLMNRYESLLESLPNIDTVLSLYEQLRKSIANKSPALSDQILLNIRSLFPALGEITKLRRDSEKYMSIHSDEEAMINKYEDSINYSQSTTQPQPYENPIGNNPLFPHHTDYKGLMIEDGTPIILNQIRDELERLYAELQHNTYGRDVAIRNGDNDTAAEYKQTIKHIQEAIFHLQTEYDKVSKYKYDDEHTGSIDIQNGHQPFNDPSKLEVGPEGQPTTTPGAAGGRPPKARAEPNDKNSIEEWIETVNDGQGLSAQDTLTNLNLESSNYASVPHFLQQAIDYMRNIIRMQGQSGGAQAEPENPDEEVLARNDRTKAEWFKIAKDDIKRTSGKMGDVTNADIYYWTDEAIQTYPLNKVPAALQELNDDALIAPDDDTADFSGQGLKRGRGRPKGRGIAIPFKDKVDTSRGIEPERRFVKFGRYLINTHKLNDNVVAIKTPSGTNITKYPSQRVSSHLSTVFKKIIGGGVPSFNELSKLNDDEKNYLYNVSKKAEIADKLSIPTPSKDQKEQDIHEYEVMKGEILSGNDNKELIKKFKVHMSKLSRQGILPKKEVNEILTDLLELGH